MLSFEYEDRPPMNVVGLIGIGTWCDANWPCPHVGLRVERMIEFEEGERLRQVFTVYTSVVLRA